MKILLAGASGAIGIPLTRQLIARGHEVIGLTRRPEAAASIIAAGAQPAIADVLDRADLVRAVKGLSADAVIHELTALKTAPARHSGMAPTDRLRIDGTANLLVAAETVGATTFLTQSIIFGYGYSDHGDRILTEKDPFGRPAGNAYNIVDNEPATWKDVFTAMAEAYGAPRPRNLPRWVLRLAAPYVTSFAFDTSMRVSNAKAKTELGWSPKYSTYREGIQAGICNE